MREWRKETVQIQFRVSLPKKGTARSLRLKAASLRLDDGKRVALVPVLESRFIEVGKGVTTLFFYDEFKVVGAEEGMAERVDRIEGEVEVFDPGHDPEACVVVTDALRKCGRLMKIDPKRSMSVFLADKDHSEAYQKFLETREDKLRRDIAARFKVSTAEFDMNRMLIYVADRDAAWKSFELQDPMGIPLEGVRISHVGDQYLVQFKNGIPSDAVLAVYFLTRYSLYSVRLEKW
jgi:hypothetical protein